MELSSQPHRGNPAVLCKALQVARPCWPHLTAIVLLGLLSMPVTLLVSLPLKIAVAMTVGEFLLVMAYIAQLYEPLRTIGTKVPELQSTLASLHRAFALLEENPEMDALPRAAASLRAPARVSGEVEFRNVSFQYTAGGRKVLDDISFHIRAGMRVGLVGPSGSGKSTLVNLLTRFYEPSDGAILIDHTDLLEYNVAELRQQFSIVLQEPMLFSSTIAGNIAYANPQASRADVIRAAKLANAHEFIQRLPQGYDTVVGDGGAGLSDGERHRLAIARAFLKDTPILILDEPTSAVDVRTERLIIEALETLMAGRTVFMIAHRLSTLERCDMVLVLQNGSLHSIVGGKQESVRHALRPPAPRTFEPAMSAPLSGPFLVRAEN